MSRIGKLPVAIPQGVTASVQGGIVQVKGPKGSLALTPTSRVIVKVEGGMVVVEPQGNDRQSRADYGTTRSLNASSSRRSVAAVSSAATSVPCMRRSPFTTSRRRKATVLPISRW